MLKTLSETPQQKGVAKRMNRTLNERAKSMRLHVELPKMFWEDLVKVKDVARDKLDAKSMKCTFIGYGKDEMGYHFWDLKGHKVIQSRDVTFNEDSLYGAKAATNSGNLMKPNQKDQVSPGGSSYTSEGSKNSGSFEDSGRSDEEDSIDGEFSKKGGSETLQVRRSTRESKALVRLLAGKKALQSKWVFRVKEKHDNRKRYKARLVVKGFQQKHEVDYNEIFSPVVKMTTIKLVLKGFKSAGKEENLMCKLKKRLHGLKQALRQWYLKFDSFMKRPWYKRYAMDHCCYLKKVGSSSIILLLYVDDMLVAGFDMAEIKKLKR
ncbi:putative RNA-directed DNA polymerase [Tanacetum coccineum]